MTDPHALDRPPRTYEGACDDIRRKERERIASVLRQHARGREGADYDTATAKLALSMVADLIEAGEL